MLVSEIFVASPLHPPEPCPSTQQPRSGRFWSGMTLYEVLTLLCAAAVPIALGIYTGVSSFQESKEANQKREFDLQLAAQLRQQSVYDQFIDDFYKFHRYGDLDDSAEPWAFANGRYWTAHEQLNIHLKLQALIFFKNRQLIGRYCRTRDAQLVKLRDVIELKGLNFDGVHFESPTNGHILLNMKCVHFDQITLVGASFESTDLDGASFDGSDLSGVTFDDHTSLVGASFNGTLLARVNFGIADLRDAIFLSVDLSYTMLTPLQLQVAQFHNCTLPNGTNSGTTPVVAGSSSTVTTTTGKVPTQSDTSKLASLLLLTSYVTSYSETSTESVSNGAIVQNLTSSLEPPIDTSESVQLISTGEVFTSREISSTIAEESMTTATKLTSSEEFSLSSTLTSADTSTINTEIFCANWSVNATTIAGNSSGADGSDSASLRSVFGIYLDSNDTLYAVDPGNRRVMMWPAGAMEGIPIGETEFDAYYIHADADESLYISVSGSVMKYNQTTNSWKTVAGGNGNVNGSDQLYYPNGIRVDQRSGDIYVAEYGAQRVSLWKQNEPQGTLLAGGVQGKDAVHLDGPYGIFVDEKEHALYVADRWNHRIQRFQPIGNTTGETVAGNGLSGFELNQLNDPHAVFVVNSVDIYITDTNNNRVMQWKLGNYAAGGCCVAGCSEMAGAAPNELRSPYDLKFDSNGNLIVSDYGNNRVQKFHFNY